MQLADDMIGTLRQDCLAAPARTLDDLGLSARLSAGSGIETRTGILAL